MKKPLIVALMVALVPAGAALAQDQGSRKQKMEEFNKRFAAADTNGDGKLTLDEAKSGMPKIAEHFDEIDVDHKGYITKQDIAASMKKMRGARKSKEDNAN